MRKIFIIAGEASGDLHGANLVKALLDEDSDLIIHAYGGPKMAAAGAKVVRSYEDFAFMGFYEVLVNISKVWKNLKDTTSIIEDFRPDKIIFIDFPSFNLRVAQRLKKSLDRTEYYYYISPKVWAWKTKRIHTINKLMDRVFVIFPFEESFYSGFGYDSVYVGNPLLDEIQSQGQIAREQSLIAVLPGSRKQEITTMLPIFSELSNRLPDLKFEVSVMPHFNLEFYKENAKSRGSNLVFSERSTYQLLAASTAALVTSGTATLETALLNTPQIVAYKTSRISYEIGKRVIKTKYISLVNLILERPAVLELIQDDLNPERLQKELVAILNNDAQIKSDYKELRNILGDSGASKRTAQFVLEGL